MIADNFGARASDFRQRMPVLPGAKLRAFNSSLWRDERASLCDDRLCIFPTTLETQWVKSQRVHNF